MNDLKLSDLLEYVQCQADREASFTRIFKHFTKGDLIRKQGFVVSGIIRLLNSGDLKEKSRHLYCAPLIKGDRKIFTAQHLNEFKEWLSNGVVCGKCLTFHPVSTSFLDAIELSDIIYYSETGNPIRIKTVLTCQCVNKECNQIFSHNETTLNDHFFHIQL